MHLVRGTTLASNGQEKFFFLYFFERYSQITLLLAHDIPISPAPKRKSNITAPADSVSGESLLPGSRQSSYCVLM